MPELPKEGDSPFYTSEYEEEYEEPPESNFKPFPASPSSKNSYIELQKRVALESKNGNIPINVVNNSSNLWKNAQRLIVLATAGAFLGGLTGITIVGFAGAILGISFGLCFESILRWKTK